MSITLHSITGDLSKKGEVSGSLSVPQSRIVVESYQNLSDKPALNSVTIEGDKASEDYHLQSKMETLTQQEIEKILYLD